MFFFPSILGFVGCIDDRQTRFPSRVLSSCVGKRKDADYRESAKKKGAQGRDREIRSEFPGMLTWWRLTGTLNSTSHDGPRV